MDRFRENLKQQLQFIANSCEGYDRGKTIEAIRISTPLRVLFHTKRSPSLLKHLGTEQVPILSTCPIRQSISEGLAFDGLTCICGEGIQPKLGPNKTDLEIPAFDWWQQHVLSLGDGHILSRKDIVLTTVNKNGGAHVDDRLPQYYEKLVDGLWISSTEGGPLINHQFPCLRQMGYEVLHSPQLLALAGYKSSTDLLKEPVRKGMWFTDFESGPISPEEKRKIFEESARMAPIRVPSNSIRYSSSCRLCHKKIEGEFPLVQKEKWINCEKGHLSLIQRVPKQTPYPIDGQNAYKKILYKLRGNSLAKKLAADVFSFYGESLIYSESRETLINPYYFDIEFEPKLLFRAVRISLKLGTGQEKEDLAHALLYVQLPMLGFLASHTVDIPDGMHEESKKFFISSYPRIRNLIFNEIIINKFKDLGYRKHRFFKELTPPISDYKAKVLLTSPQNADWQSSFSWWCLEYFGLWVTSRHGQSLKLQSSANEALKWGSELHPMLMEAAERMREWVMLGEYKNPDQYISQVNNLLEIMKIPKVINWLLLENSTSQQPTARIIEFPDN